MLHHASCKRRAQKSATPHIPVLLSAQTKTLQHLFLQCVRAPVEPHVLVPIAGQADQQQAFWCAGRSTDSLWCSSSLLCSSRTVWLNSNRVRLPFAAKTVARP